MNLTAKSKARAIVAGALAVCAVVALAAACSGDDGTTTTVSIVPASSASPAAVSGIPEVDHIINAAAAGNMIELAALTGYQRVACGTDEDGAPPCRDSESAGDEVEVLASSACERTWVRPELATQSYRSALGSGLVSPLAVYKPNDGPDTFGGGFGAQYVAVLSTGKRGDGAPAGVALHLTNGRVTWLERECTELSELLRSDRVDSFVVDPAAPPEASATPAAAEPTASP